jgi:glycerol-3-phosphate acyltransferase PlsY
MMICFTDRVSVGSMTGAAALPVGIWVSTSSPALTTAAAVLAAAIVIRHKANIRRLLIGQEPPLGRQSGKHPPDHP